MQPHPMTIAHVRTSFRCVRSRSSRDQEILTQTILHEARARNKQCICGDPVIPPWDFCGGKICSSSSRHDRMVVAAVGEGKEGGERGARSEEDER